MVSDCDNTEKTRSRSRKMRGPCGHQGQCQRMLAEHDALDHIERETREESESESAGARRLDGPVKDHQHQKIRAQRIERRWASGITASASATSAESAIGRRRMRVSRIIRRSPRPPARRRWRRRGLGRGASLDASARLWRASARRARGR